MAKLHEVLAVEASLGKTASKLMSESSSTLSKENLFFGSLRKLEMFDADQVHLNTTDEVELTTTVQENLDYLVGPIAAYWDAVFQKDKTNQVAVANIVVDGVTIAENVPAVFLLGLETKLTELRIVYNNIKTTPPGLKWAQDPERQPGVLIAEAPVTFKTEKVHDFKVLYEATKEHPAQIAEVSKTVNVGRYDTTRWTGLMTPLEKAQRLQRIDSLILAVKKARQRANDAELVSAQIGTSLLNYINAR